MTTDANQDLTPQRIDEAAYQMASAITNPSGQVPIALIVAAAITLLGESVRLGVVAHETIDKTLRKYVRLYPETSAVSKLFVRGSKPS